MDTLSNSEESDKSQRPSPADFDNFLPWACYQMQLEIHVQIFRTEQDNYSGSYPSSRIKARKVTKNKEEVVDANIAGNELQPIKMISMMESEVVNIYTFYDQNNRLVQLKFPKNKNIPRGLLQIITLIIQFYPRLTTMKINGGLKQDGLYEISKFVSRSKITEMILDDSVILEANYYILLEDESTLKYLSLARCKLNDAAVELIASKLLTSSLSILNLTSNRITDVGAKHLGDVLRSNRALTYLNLAGNMITDTGAVCILSCLGTFPLDPNEITAKKIRYMTYLRKKKALAQKIYNDLFALNLSATDIDRKNMKKKSIKPVMTPVPRKSRASEKDTGSVKQLQLNKLNMDPMMFEKAEELATTSMGPYKDPFSSENTISKDGTLYCLGNNALCYLSLAYNNLSYFSVKKLYEVLTKQKDLNRTPRGLVNVCIEGNNIPEACPELTEISYIIESGLTNNRRISTMIRRRPVKIQTK